jgi:hypothetical protein
VPAARTQTASVKSEPYEPPQDDPPQGDVAENEERTHLPLQDGRRHGLVRALSSADHCRRRPIPVISGERSLRRALSEYVQHFHAERNHQGKGNVLLFPRDTDVRREGAVQCRERLGGLLRYYHQEAA